jgi:hypothetical protein
VPKGEGAARAPRAERWTTLAAAFVGAMIGAGASFAGTYVSISATQDRERAETVRLAFIDVNGKAAQYTADLYELGVNPARYTSVRRQLAEQNGPLNAAIANVLLLTGGTVADSVDDIQGALFRPVIPVDPRKVDRDAIRQAVADADNALRRFRRAARDALEAN